MFDHKLILIREVSLGQTLPGEDVLIVVLEYKLLRSEVRSGTHMGGRTNCCACIKVDTYREVRLG